MKRSIGLWQLMGFAVTLLGGTLLHFLYDLTESSLIAPLSGVNESTWEHMKLLFWPMFIFAIVQSFFFRGREDFWCVKLKGTLLGLWLIPVLFYTYNGAIGKSPDWINISIFFISAAVAYIYETHQFNNGTTACKKPKLAITALCVIAILFVIFTFYTPEIGIFKDPLTGTYGKGAESLRFGSLLFDTLIKLMFMGMSFLCACKERTKESTQGGRLRGALLDHLHALAGAQPHGGMRANTNGVGETRGVSLRSARGC